MHYLTVSDVAAQTGHARADILEALRAGRVPGATRRPGGAWAIPRDVAHLAAPVTHPGPAVSGGDATGPGATRPDTGALEDDPATPRLRALIETARRVDRVLAPVSTRSARAAASSVWRHVEVASRHDVDRDGACRHDAWSWPCPDYRDAADAVRDLAAVILEGAES